MTRLRAGVAGFSGYSGAELVGRLKAHPRLEPWLLEHRQDSDERPRPAGQPHPPQIPCTREAVRSEKLDVVFLATPAAVSIELTPWLLQAGVRVIDLSGAFRLRTVENYRRWYREEHSQPALLAEAAYGLPEYSRDSVRTARLVANPGCYPTAANLAIRPLLEAGVVDRACGVVCDAKSGVSGAGHAPARKTSFCEVTENFSAYSILDHRHVPEVLLTCGLEEREFSFTAQLLPVDRGILETIYLRTTGVESSDALMDVFRRRYASEPFLKLYPDGVPDLRAVARTNFCALGVKCDPATGRAVVVSAIDNLVKGAAGQAVQNMNLMFGFDETEGLL